MSSTGGASIISSSSFSLSEGKLGPPMEESVWEGVEEEPEEELSEDEKSELEGDEEEGYSAVEPVQAAQESITARANKTAIEIFTNIPPF